MVGDFVRNWENSVFVQNVQLFIKPRRILSTCSYAMMINNGTNIEINALLKLSSWKWRDFIKRHTQYNGCRKNRWSRYLPENGNSWKIDKHQNALHAENLLPSIEVYCMIELNLSLQAHIIGDIENWKENPLIGKLRDRSYEFLTCPTTKQIWETNSSTIIGIRFLNC